MAERRPPTKIDFGELASSENFTAPVLKLSANLDATSAHLEALAKCDVDKLSTKEHVMLDLFLAYSVNSLYWMFLRTKGINPVTHPIKSEINRVREGVERANKILNRKEPTNRLNKEAAKRFIRSGMWTAGAKPAGGVVKKFDSTNVEVKGSSSVSQVNEKGAAAEAKQVKPPNGNKARVKKFDPKSCAGGKASSSYSKVNEKDGETRQFKPPNGGPNTEGLVKKFDPKSFVGGNASSSCSKVNEKDGETRQFKPPNGRPNTEGLVKKFDPKRFGDEKGTSSYRKVNKKGEEVKQFKSPNRQPEALFKQSDSMNIEKASTSFSKVNKKGGETKKFDSTNVGVVEASTSYSQVIKKRDRTTLERTNWHIGTDNKKVCETKKFDPTNVGVVEASTSYSQVTKDGGTKQYKAKASNSNTNGSNSKTIDSRKVDPSFLFAPRNEKGGEAEQFKFQNRKTGKKTKHGKPNYHTKKGNKTTFPDAD